MPEISGRGHPSSDPAVDALLKKPRQPNRGRPALVVVCYLSEAGRLDLAKTYWRQVGAASESNFWWRVIANGVLRKQ